LPRPSLWLLVTTCPPFPTTPLFRFFFPLFVCSYTPPPPPVRGGQFLLDPPLRLKYPWPFSVLFDRFFPILLTVVILFMPMSLFLSVSFFLIFSFSLLVRESFFPSVFFSPRRRDLPRCLEFPPPHGDVSFIGTPLRLFSTPQLFSMHPSNDCGFDRPPFPLPARSCSFS